jgi:hypothetical protein
MWHQTVCTNPGRHNWIYLTKPTAVTTYEQALTWLGADASMADDFIASYAAVKVSLNMRSWNSLSQYF